MKIRNGFVSNSSSSSFLCVMAGDKHIFGDKSVPCESKLVDIEIDKLIKTLQKAKKDGAKTVTFEYGGEYHG